MGMKDLGENLFVLDAIRAKDQATGTFNTRINGAHNIAEEIDLADYNYPKEILIHVNVGAVTGAGKVTVSVRSGVVTGALNNVDYAMAQISAVGAATYHYKPTRRYINLRAVVATNNVTFAVVAIMGALGWGSSGQA